jgi:mRNA interferase RelE/StbE
MQVIIITMNEINWKNKARRQPRKIQKQDQVSIIGSIDALEDLETARNVKKLTNHQYDYRLRVGNYRDLFNHDGEIEIVTVEGVKKRDDRTY